MRKIRATILSIASISALACLAAATAVDKNFARAQAQETQSVLSSELIAPKTYEEYLKLDKPSCSAVCENYTAIADGNEIYLYDRADSVYRKYTHTVNAELSQNNINQLQFDEDENLYFLDGSFLFVMETDKFDTFSTATATTTGFPCDNFLIDGQSIYYVEAKTPAVISKTELQAPSVSTAKKITDVGGKPDLAMFDGELYFVDASAQMILYKVNPQTPQTLAQVAILSGRIEHMTVCDGAYAYTTPTGDLYVQSLTDNTANGLQYFESEGGYSRLTSYGGNIYVTQKQAGVVKEYSVAQQAFTDFEISSNSSADHRLSGATDLALFGNELYIADDNNRRLSVYDCAAKTLSARFPLTTEVSFLSADENYVFTASKQTLTAYSKNGEMLASFSSINGDIVGIASVYGTCYAVTESNYFYAVSKIDNAWQITETKKTSTHPPQLLAADAYGNLYIKSSAYAYVFTEDEFMLTDNGGTKIIDDLPTDCTKIAVDYDKNLYALSDDVYKFERQANGNYTQSNVSLNASFVYGDTPTLTSFAFGIENNTAYILCDGNYIFATSELLLPTVTNIPVNGADENIFAEREASFEIVKTHANALLVAFNVEQLKGASNYPYLSYQRSGEEKTALKIGEDASGKYNLIAHFDTQTSKYSTYLVLKTSCEIISTDDYRVPYTEDKQVSAWLTNEISLYKFPYLCGELIVAQSLPRGAQITLLGEIGQLDHTYYHVSYVDENGETKTGYIPQSYASLFDASPKDSVTTQIGKTESNHDGVWRLSYILLGFAAICILVAFLILRPKKED